MDKKELMIALSMVLASAAFAQDAEKPTQSTVDAKPAPQAPTKKAGSKAETKSGDAKAGDEKSDAPAKPEPIYPYLSAAYGDWRFNGNSHKFTQYATPPRGFYLRDFSYEPETIDRRHWGYFEAKAPGQDDYRLDSRIQLFNGTFNAEFSNNRARFFSPSPQLIDQSQHLQTEAYLKQMLGQNFSLTFRNRFEQKDFYQQAPTDPENQRSRYWDLSARGSVGANGFLDLSYSDIRYWDRTLVEPDSDTRRIGATYRHELTDNLSLEGTYSHSTIDQDGYAQSKIDTWGIGSRWNATESTSFFANFRQDKLDLPNVQNAHDRARTRWDAKIVQQLPSNWIAQASYAQLDLERYRGDLTYVDVPRIHTYEGKISGPLTPAFRVSAKLMRQTLDGQAIMTDIHNTATAYFRNRWNAQVKVDTTGEFVNAYFVYSYNANLNDARGSNIGDTGLTFGASWQAKPNVDFYGEVSTDRWSASTGNARTADIGSYFPDGTTWTLGGNYTINPKLSISAGYTGVLTRNDNPLLLQDGNIHGNYFNGTVTYKDPHGWNLALTYAPSTYRDHVYDLMNYTSGLIDISASTKF